MLTFIVKGYIIVSNETVREERRLNSTIIFNGLTEAEIKSITDDERCVIESHSAGEEIYSAENFRKAVGIVIDGTVVAQSSENGGVTMRLLSGGECFGVAAVFSGAGRYVSYISAKTDCRILFIPEEVISESIRNIPLFAQNYISFLTTRIQYLNTLVDAYSSPNVEMRLARYIVAYVGGSEVPFDFNMTALSKSLGIGRASLYRALDELESDGLIKREKGRITVTDIEKLKKY